MRSASREHAARRRATRRRPTRWDLALPIALSSAVALGSAAAQTLDSQVPDLDALAGMSIEDLLQVEVYSVSKRTASLADSPAAVFVITREQLQRSGAPSIPEALRMVPGVEVGRIGANKWAVSVRGFNGRYANRLLVLIDGRSIYTSAFSGVYWEATDLVVDDIDRIEVIRGPGAVLWGSNAVNGVINIITRDARDGEGGLVAVRSGTETPVSAATRYETTIGDDLGLRIYTRYHRQDAAADLDGREAGDDGRALRGGARLDWALTSRDRLTVQADLHHRANDAQRTLPTFETPYTEVTDSRFEMLGAHVVGTWVRNWASAGELSTVIHYTRDELDEADDFGLTEERAAIEIEHSIGLGEDDAHRLLWGVSAEQTHTDFDNAVTLAFVPPHRAETTYAAFVQHEHAIVARKDHRLALTLGAKVERDRISGATLLPNARFIWQPGDIHAIWGAVARSARALSRADTDLRLMAVTVAPGEGENVTAMPAVITIHGREAIDRQTAWTYELGYRVRPIASLAIDIAGHYSDAKVFSTDVGTPTIDPEPVAHIDVPLVFGNERIAKAYGAEIAVDWEVTRRWRLHGAYAWLELSHEDPPGAASLFGDVIHGGSPRHQASLRSSLDLPASFEIDGWIRHVAALDAVLRTAYAEPLRVAPYTTVDLRVGWRPSDTFDIAITGRNLLHDRHVEFAEELHPYTTAVPREVDARLRLRF